MEFIVVPVNRLSAVWPKVRKDWLRVERYSNYDERTVLQKLVSGSVQLAIGRKDQKYAGFFIFKRAGNNLHIGALHSKVGLAAYEEVDNFARMAGATSMSFTSPRPGWRKRAAALGFKPWATVYRKELK